ncbi:MAG: type 1 glutamine amidotransferase [Actinomycetota bacterium]
MTRVGLLVCGALPDDYLSIAGDFTEMFSKLLGDCGIDLVSYNAFLGELPDDPSECDGYVIGGSKSAVYDDEKWIRDLEAFVRSTADAAVPVFGVCFGLQVMATALGGTVVEYDGGWGAGVHTVAITESRSWMDGESDSVSLIMIHQDQIVALPDGALVLGSSEHCANFLVEFSPTHIGIQGHPEFNAAFAEYVYRKQRGEFGLLADEAIASLIVPVDDHVVASWMCRLIAGIA